MIHKIYLSIFENFRHNNNSGCHTRRQYAISLYLIKEKLRIGTNGRYIGLRIIVCPRNQIAVFIRVNSFVLDRKQLVLLSPFYTRKQQLLFSKNEYTFIEKEWFR